MLRKTGFIVAATLSALLAGCGGAGGLPASSGLSSGGSAGAATFMTVNSVTVTDTHGATVTSGSGNAATFDSQAGGLFTLSFNTSTDSPVGANIQAFLSTAPGGTANDQMIFERNCGSPGSTCTSTSYSYPCLYDQSAETINCPSTSTSPADSYAIGQYLSNNGGVPATYYLVLKGCAYDAQGNALCDQKDIPVVVN